MRRRRTHTVALAVLAINVHLLTGCSDAVGPIGRDEIDRTTVQTAMPITLDAAERLHAGIADAATAHALGVHLLGLQQALETLDRRRAVENVHNAAGLLAGYARAGASDDAADVTAIQLMLADTAEELSAPLNPALIP